jgi:choline dehydrogenase
MSFDYIIVGAGSAGCVLADRLSADGKSNVLLLEAGPADNNPFVHMPKGMAKIFANPEQVWFIPTEATGDIPSETWIRGKMLGGSSSVNGMMYFRGHPEDYNEWERLGATGWGWDQIGAAFEAIENKAPNGGEKPLRISTNPNRTPLTEAYIAAGREMGLPEVPDLNHAEQEGVGYAPWTVGRGRRSSAAQAFLKPARSRPNLTVETGVLVDKVIFEGKRAVGVTGTRGGATIEFRTAGEVILSAGALTSPVILQRSGIGPADHLQSIGIPVIHDSPHVGTNLLEHRLMMMEYGLTKPISSNPEYRGAKSIFNGIRYFLTHKGPLASGSYEVGAFVRTAPGLARPDAEILMASYSFGLNEKGEVGINDGHGMHLFGYPLRSRSAGTIMARSADPTDPAIIRPNYLSDPYDQAVTVTMVRYMRQWLAQPAIAPLLTEETVPGPSVQTDAEIINAFRTRGQAGYHACGTVAMGGADAPLDPQLRVRGVDNLRVVDGSILPTMVSANTNGPIMAMGWRAAQIILQGRNR